jgi:hypothetical protein
MSYIGQQLPADVFSGFVTDSFTGDGSATTFTLSKAPFSEDALIVVINNVIQKPVTNFTVSGTTLTIVGTAVASGDVIYAMHTSGAVPSTLASKVDVNGLSDGVILDADADTTISADTDDQIDFKAGGTDIMSLTATTATFNDGVTITTADNTDQLTLISTDADASAGPKIAFTRTSSSPADNDIVGQFSFTAQNDAGEATDYCRFRVHLTDVSDGTEDGNFRLFTLNGGAENSRIDIDATETVFNEDSSTIDFRVEGDSNTHALFVNAATNFVGMGTDSTTAGTLKIAQPAADLYCLMNEASASSGNMYIQRNTFTGQSPDNNTSFAYWCNDTTTARFGVYSDGDVLNHDNSYGAFSDERIKQDIRDSNSQWDDIKAVKVRNFKKKDDVRQYGDKAWEQIGVIAQELEAAGMDKLIKHGNPSEGDIASDSSFGTLYKDGDTIPEGKKIGDIKEIKAQVKKVGYSVLYMKAIKALQEAMAKIETLETKVKALEDA